MIVILFQPAGLKLELRKGDFFLMKNAFCILAHNEPEILKILLSILDDTNNDIYIHIDKKSKCFNEKILCDLVKKANIVFIARRNIGWGGENMIFAELDLLKEAAKIPHSYYHMLSGVDLPIRPLSEINEFLKMNMGKEFLGVTPNWANSDEVKTRYTKYYFGQDYIGKNKSNILYYLSRGMAKIQQRIPMIDRTCKIDFQFYGGPVWFSLTQDAIDFLLSKENIIKKVFKNTYCCDEIFVQTILMNSEFADKIYMKMEGDCYDSCRRYVKFDRESPKTLDINDLAQIDSSGFLFARKFGTKTKKQKELLDIIKDKCLK